MMRLEPASFPYQTKATNRMDIRNKEKVQIAQHMLWIYTSME